MQTDLIQFIRSYREPVTISEAASELHMLGTYNVRGWPRATREHWVREIEALVDQGALAKDSEGFVSVPMEVKQGRLFE